LPSKLGGLATAMKNRFYFDEFYEATFIRAHDLIAMICGGIDRWLLEGLLSARFAAARRCPAAACVYCNPAICRPTRSFWCSGWLWCSILFWENNMSILTYIAGWPLIGGLVASVCARKLPGHCSRHRRAGHLHFHGAGHQNVSAIQRRAVDADGYRFVQQIPWVDSLGISYHVGVDGLERRLILMGAIVAFAATLCSWEIQTREKEFYILLLIMTGGILGTFASLDLFFFYFLHELALIPTFIMIGVWGRGERKNYATFQITLYLSLGALDRFGGLDCAVSSVRGKYLRHPQDNCLRQEPTHWR
jgi:NADH:ubiquinone oxidoreductase subunit 5 (subunit L)/multisubunit Na+/H+ antiporter MnhA subunit